MDELSFESEEKGDGDGDGRARTWLGGSSKKRLENRSVW